MKEKNQGRLLDVENPLIERLGQTFFDEIPKVPGIYKMYSRNGQLLYVGKAKNLRTRLFTYKRVKSVSVSAKVKKLIRMIYRIEYECCGTEKEALLRENKLIREHKPGFNVAKKRPHTYYYFKAVPADSGISFSLSMSLDQEYEAFTYGAFKGHNTVRKGMGALLRQLYLQEHEIASVFNYPGMLLKNLTPLKYDLEIHEGRFITGRIRNEVRLFLEGKSLDLMSSLVQSVTERDLLQDFMGRMILKDFESLKTFYDYGPRRNHHLAETLNLSSHLIPQHKLDDYLVQAAFE